MAKTDTLFPILQSPQPSSLARAAAAAPLHSTGCLTEYRPIHTRSIVGKTSSKRGLPFTHTINPYRGCEFACRYCYARYTHEFLEIRNPDEFEHKIYFKENAAWLLEQELARLKTGTEIALGTATDPYQPLERKQRVTRSLLEVFARQRGFGLGIVTKSALIVRDLDLLKEIAARHRLTVHLTVTTMNTRLARILEPRAPRPDLRIRTLARLREAGIRAGVLCSPLMPGVTDTRSSIAAIARAAAGAGAWVSPEYRNRMAGLVDSICREYKLGKRYVDPLANEDEVPDPPARIEVQPWLPFAQNTRQRTDVA